MKNQYFLFFLLAISLTSCLRDSTKNSNKAVFRYNEAAGISSLDPAFAKAQSEVWACNHLFNGLIQLDDSLVEKPAIAKSWEISADGLVYTFNLRTDVFFQDHKLFQNGKGRKVIAADFVYSLNRILDDKISSPGAWIFNNVKKNADGKPMFIALNDSTFEITLESSFPPFLGLLSMPYCSVVPQEIVKHYGTDFRMNPVGTGPFQFKLWDEGVNLILVKNENYFERRLNGKRKPYLHAVMVTFIKDKQTAFLEFSQGNLDFLSGIDPSYKDELLNRNGGLSDKYKEKINLISQPYLNTEYLGILVDPKLNNSKALNDKRVRQALNYGFDREKMIQYLRNGIGTPGTRGFVPVGLPGSLEQDFYNYNPNKAKQLLTEAGYPNGKGLPEISLSTNSAYLDLCEFIARQYEEIGVKVKVDVNPPATHREMVAKSKMNFFRASWIADYADAENYLVLFYSKNFSPQGPNTTHFKNTKFDALYEQSQKTLNKEERIKLYQKMDLIIAEEAPVVVLFYDQVLRFYHKNISNLGGNPMNLLNLKNVRKINMDVYSYQEKKRERNEKVKNTSN